MSFRNKMKTSTSYKKGEKSICGKHFPKGSIFMALVRGLCAGTWNG
jgi:hypothetical protein